MSDTGESYYLEAGQGDAPSFDTSSFLGNPLAMPGGNGWGESEWADLIKTAGSTYNQIAHPSAQRSYPPSSGTYSGSQISPQTPNQSVPFSMQSLMDFHTPYPYMIIGGVFLLVIMSRQGSNS